MSAAAAASAPRAADLSAARPRRPVPVALVLATHPLPCVAVTAFVTVIAARAGIGTRCVLLAAAVLCGQLSVGWSNDAIDAPRDAAARRADKPVATGEVSRRLVAACAGVALAVDVPLSLALGWRPGLLHLAAVGLAWSYNAGMKRSMVSPLPYAAAFGLVPVVVAAMKPGAPAPRIALILAGVAAGIAAHFANTVGDAAEDRLTGVRGLPQRLGPARSTVVAAAFVAAAAVAVLVGVGPRPLAVAAAVADVVLAAATPWLVHAMSSRRRAFRAVIAAVAILVVAFVVAGGARLT
jgi:4-hydroxybenzoate polyprenyltransferase